MNARHAAPEGSFARSAGGAAGRGLMLVGLAVLLGVALMYWGLDGPGDGAVAAPGTTTGSTAPGDSTGSTAPGDTTGSSVPGDGTTVPGTTQPLAPETVKVVVANGAGVQGIAASFTDQLNTQNYVTLAPTNADANTYTTSIVYFTAGNPNSQQAAQQVATLLNIATPPAAIPATVPLRDAASLGDAMVLVVIGSDLAAATA